MNTAASAQPAHAVVLGASMSGLLAARVLADQHGRVTLVDRDPVPALVGPRRGVPQGRHIRALHARGLQILEELFPGLIDTLVDDGAVAVDLGARVRTIVSGRHLRQVPLGLPGVLCSRPFLEQRVRARVLALPRVEFCRVAASPRRRVAASGLVASADNRRITGVRIVPDAGEESVLPADLVVDATGRGSRTPTVLAQIGYGRPVEDRVEIGLVYATRLLRLRPGALGGDVAVVHAATPSQPRSGFVAEIEGGLHLASLAGVLGDVPPTDLGAFGAFARGLASPDIADALVGAQPLDDGVTFRFPASVRRRYERMPALPDGLLVVGDGVCSFNPVYGQGMTVAALEALLLRDMLARHPALDPRRWYRAVARVVDSPWQVAVGADLAFPQVPGRRTVQVRLANAYLPRLHAAAVDDAALAVAFARVVGLVDPPERLLRPDRVARVAIGAIHRRTRARPPVAARDRAQ